MPPKRPLLAEEHGAYCSGFARPAWKATGLVTSPIGLEYIMKLLRKFSVATIPRGGLTRLCSYRRLAWRVRSSSICLVGIVGALITVGRCDAQNGTGLVQISDNGIRFPPLLESMPLTVRPHAMATGTQTPKAGQYNLDSLKDYLVYVPEKCVGTGRCPLVVFLHQGAETSQNVVQEWSPVSDKYGTILLAPSSPDDWQLADEKKDQINVDAAMKQVFSKFAIDPDRIALIGYSASGGGAMGLGGYRLDMFSRIILGSTDFSIATVDPRNKTAQFLLTSGLQESRDCFNEVIALRRAGHPVKQVIGLRGHSSKVEDWDLMGRWLQESWAKPDPRAQPAPIVVTKSVPLLTTEVVKKMTIFWNRFRDEADSIRTTARLAHLREVAVPVGGERVSVLMMDMPALASKYPSVAADLKEAGLTAQEHDTYRVALVSAVIGNFTVHGPVFSGSHMDQSRLPPGVGKILDSLDRLDSRGKSPVFIDTASVQGKNLEFVATHKDIIQELRSTHMWGTP